MAISESPHPALAVASELLSFIPQAAGAVLGTPFAEWPCGWLSVADPSPSGCVPTPAGRRTLGRRPDRLGSECLTLVLPADGIHRAAVRRPRLCPACGVGGCGEYGGGGGDEGSDDGGVYAK